MWSPGAVSGPCAEGFVTSCFSHVHYVRLVMTKISSTFYIRWLLLTVIVQAIKSLYIRNWFKFYFSTDISNASINVYQIKNYFKFFELGLYFLFVFRFYLRCCLRTSNRLGWPWTVRVYPYMLVLQLQLPHSALELLFSFLLTSSPTPLIYLFLGRVSLCSHDWPETCLRLSWNSDLLTSASQVLGLKACAIVTGFHPHHTSHF